MCSPDASDGAQRRREVDGTPGSFAAGPRAARGPEHQSPPAERDARRPRRRRRRDSPLGFPPDAVLRCRKFPRTGDLALRGRQGPLGARPDEPRRYQLSRDGDSVDVPNGRMLPSGLSNSDLVGSLRSTTFISAGREMQLDAYPVPRSSAHVRGDVGRSGEYAPYWYLEFADDEVSPMRRHPTDNRETVRAQVDAWLGELFPGARANAERLAVDAPVRLSFSLGQKSPWSKPASVGYGVSYAFPMLVALLTAEPGSTVVIDSAEAHLHPRAQSAVGYLLARMAGSGLQHPRRVAQRPSSQRCAACRSRWSTRAQRCHHPLLLPSRSSPFRNHCGGGQERRHQRLARRILRPDGA